MACGVGWGVVEAGAAVEDEGRDIWHISFFLRKHFTSIWPFHEQKSHLEPLEALFHDGWDEEVEEDDAGDVDAFCECLAGAEDAAKAEVVEDKLARVWSMFRSD